MSKRREPSPHIEVRHRQAAASVARKQPERTVVDLTSKGEEPWVRFSPFYPHGGIPVPFSDGRIAASVEGVWQGLKVFANHDVCEATLKNTTMRGLKRTVRKHGRCLGHRRGVDGTDLLGYGDARRLIYLPTYRWVLENALATELAELTRLAADGPVTLLDYETNCDIDRLDAPLSHAGLVAAAMRAALASADGVSGE